MIISVASGKGGTGKTTVAVNLALSLAENSLAVRFLDCDVEEPDAHIFLKPKIELTKQVGIPVPEIDESKCSYCGKCSEVCEFNAIVVINPAKDSKEKNSSTASREVKKKVLTFYELCHGCGGCSLFCPQEAITEVDREIGVVEGGKSRGIDFFQGRLNIGEPMAVPLIRKVKQYADNNKITIIDVSPGTSCPVVESVRKSDFCILVTEPTPFGLNDLKLAVEVLRKLKIPFGLVLNQFDIGDEKVYNYCNEEKVLVLLKIPFDKRIAVAYSKGIPLVKELPEYKEKFWGLYKRIRKESQIE